MSGGALLLALLVIGCAQEGPLVIEDARLRAVIPGQDKTAGYFSAHNTGTTSIVLTGASSAAARAIEIHTTIREGDVARMRRLEEVVIGAGETVRFEPGGRHLMLFGVTDLEASTELVLEAADGRRWPIEFRTVAIGD